jgi:hypothetical protein
MIENNNGKIILFDENVFIVRYSNFQSIISCISSYITNVTLFIKQSNLQKLAAIKALFQIKNILYEEIGQIELLVRSI